MMPRSERSIPELFSDAVGQLAKLIGNEFALARAELSDKAGQVGRAAAMMAAGAIIMIPALVMLLTAAASALMHAGLSDPAAYLIAGGCAAIVSGLLILVGMNRLSGDALKPTVTIDEIERDKAAAKELVR